MHTMLCYMQNQTNSQGVFKKLVYSYLFWDLAAVSLVLRFSFPFSSGGPFSSRAKLSNFVGGGSQSFRAFLTNSVFIKTTGQKLFSYMHYQLSNCTIPLLHWIMITLWKKSATATVFQGGHTGVQDIRKFLQKNRKSNSFHKGHKFHCSHGTVHRDFIWKH